MNWNELEEHMFHKYAAHILEDVKCGVNAIAWRLERLENYLVRKDRGEPT